MISIDDHPTFGIDYAVCGANNNMNGNSRCSVFFPFKQTSRPTRRFFRFQWKRTPNLPRITIVRVRPYRAVRLCAVTFGNVSRFPRRRSSTLRPNATRLRVMSQPTTAAYDRCAPRDNNCIWFYSRFMFALTFNARNRY